MPKRTSTTTKSTATSKRSPRKSPTPKAPPSPPPREPNPLTEQLRLALPRFQDAHRRANKFLEVTGELIPYSRAGRGQLCAVACARILSRVHSIPYADADRTVQGMTADEFVNAVISAPPPPPDTGKESTPAAQDASGACGDRVEGVTIAALYETATGKPARGKPFDAYKTAVTRKQGLLADGKYRKPPGSSGKQDVRILTPRNAAAYLLESRKADFPTLGVALDKIREKVRLFEPVPID